MKKEDLKNSFDLIKPDETARKRMLDNIMQNAGKKNESRRIYYMRAIPAFAMVAVVAAGVLMHGTLWKNNELPPGNVPGVMTDQAAGMGREDAAAPLLDQFRIDDRHYILLTDEMRNEFGLPAMIKDSDIGEKIADITVSPDESLIGSEVFRYVPAGCDAVVAVKCNDSYRLFRFFVFESYNNNQDEDAAEYLELFGINSADDIAKVVFIGHSEQSKLQGVTDIRGVLTDREAIAAFYGFYSVLKNNSDKYFDRLFNYSGKATSGNYGVEIDIAERERMAAAEGATGTAVPPDATGPDATTDLPIKTDDAAIAYQVTADTPVSADAPVSTSNAASSGSSPGMIMDSGDGAAGSVQGSAGSVGNALDDPITVRIYNKNGIYFDSVYYRNIGFISRYEVNERFAAFLNEKGAR